MFILINHNNNNNNNNNNQLYYICTEIYCKMNMSNKNDALQSTRHLIGCTIFLTSEKYRMRPYDQSQPADESFH